MSQNILLPQTVTTFREGYSGAMAKADALAGLTVAIVALPLSMAIAIASGATPAQGLTSAIVGGFFVSALGGSRFQVGGPAGAFIVLVSATIEHFGFSGFVTATLIAGLMMMALGLLRLGALIRFIPHPVIVGFSAGIAVIIGASQLRDFFGLHLTHEPAALLPKLQALWQARQTLSPAALLLSLFCFFLVVSLRKYRPHWPAFLITAGVGAILTYLLNLPVETIGTRFGGIPSGLPAPQLPDLRLETVLALLPTAATIALLGAIESLLSALVADTMTQTRHRPNMEILAQGFANCASALFGGLCVTGTIARTATNIRAHATSPVAGMAHAIFVLVFMMVAAPLARFIPLASLAAILMVVVWNMADRAEFAHILRHDRGDAAVLLLTFLVTIFVDLTTAIGAGTALGAVIFMTRAAAATTLDWDETILTGRLGGALFTGSSAKIAEDLSGLSMKGPVVTLDLKALFLVDASAVPVLNTCAAKIRNQGNVLRLINLQPQVRMLLLRDGLDPSLLPLGDPKNPEP